MGGRSLRLLAFACAAAVIAVVSVLPAAALAATDDDIPGVALPASPVAGTVHAVDDPDDVFAVALAAGDRLTISLTGDSGVDADVYLFPPGTPDVSDSYRAIAGSSFEGYPESISWVARTGGTYYIDVFAYAGNGTYTMNWTVIPGSGPPPLKIVYRFYHRTEGVHFYTASEVERDNVIATLGGTYDYEGPAYAMVDPGGPAPGTQWLHRFYNTQTGTHFYTASESERAQVVATLGHIYRYEGVAYLVATWNTGQPVYRFYNHWSGTHFYTASEGEAQDVIDTMSDIYTFEGIAFFLP